MNRQEAKDLFRKDKDAYGKPKHALKNVDAIYNSLIKQINGMCLVCTDQLPVTEEERLNAQYQDGWNQAMQKVITKLLKK
jgi:hypothetical protein